MSFLYVNCKETVSKTSFTVNSTLLPHCETNKLLDSCPRSGLISPKRSDLYSSLQFSLIPTSPQSLHTEAA